MAASTMPTTGYTLHFQSLFDPGRGYAFPCDAQGQVALDAMTETARTNLVRVETLVGCQFSVPVVVCGDTGEPAQR